MTAPTGRWTTLAASAAALLTLGGLAGCGEQTSDGWADEPSGGATTAAVAAPTDASVPAFCYAYSGLAQLPADADAAGAVERFAETGTPSGTADDVRASYEALVADLGGLEALDATAVADALAGADGDTLVDFGESTCEGVYADDFSDDAESEDETGVRALVDAVNAANKSGDCAALADLYASGADRAVDDCESGGASQLRLLGGGVLSPYSAEIEVVLSKAMDVGPTYLDVVRQGDAWLLVG
ncbi:MAG: hypothetical protein CMH83_09470 [Nocardioides sp.]|nr:hypothetical protein [Nocardioides sp.]